MGTRRDAAQNSLVNTRSKIRGATLCYISYHWKALLKTTDALLQILILLKGLFTNFKNRYSLTLIPRLNIVFFLFWSVILCHGIVTIPLYLYSAYFMTLYHVVKKWTAKFDIEGSILSWLASIRLNFFVKIAKYPFTKIKSLSQVLVALLKS